MARSLIESVRSVLESVDTRAGRLFDVSIQGLIVFSTVVFVISTEESVRLAHGGLLKMIETAVVLVFTVEYALRLAVAENRARFAFSFFGLVDLISILPFFLGLAVDFRCVRALRLVRVLRVFKIVRYNRAMIRYRRALVLAREELVLYGITSTIVLLLAAVGIHYFEGEQQPDKFGSVGRSLWWAVISLTTVGYGDVYPITVGGRIFTAIVLFTGLGLVAVPSGILASALSEARREEPTTPAE